jgi:hypothetical protein
MYHGGKTIESMTFTNSYVGGDDWQQSDTDNIDRALSAAMSEPNLKNVMAQYFSGRPPTTKFLRSQKLAAGGSAPVQFQYSNSVHGREGPVAAPEAASTYRGQHRSMHARVEA